MLIDRDLPLSFTTASSGENFRDCWPQPWMTSLTARSIDLMEEMFRQSGGAFGMRHSGYEFVSESADAGRFDWRVSDSQSSGEGMERITSVHTIRESRPYLSDSEARKAGVSLLRGEVTALDQVSSGGFELSVGNGGERIASDQLVLAAGPFSGHLAAMLGVDLPLENVLQQKFVVSDTLQVIPRDMPFTIFADPQRLAWSDEETGLIADDPEFAHLLEEFPAGLHIKPESSNQIKLGWAYNRQVQTPRWDPATDERFPEIVIRGASRFIPALNVYLDDLPGPVHRFAGYYTRTPENLPLIGPLGVENAFTISALSGYGTMAACAALCCVSQPESLWRSTGDGGNRPDRF
jgi:glycine/D-amino acid oxidase-like deaminating enzyme